MMKFNVNKCPQCGKNHTLMYSNNPIVEPICFDCINAQLDYNNLEHAEFFCRTYNLPMKPDVWMKIAPTAKASTWEQYAAAFFDDPTYTNLKYNDSTSDVWGLINKEWEKCRTQAQVISRLNNIKESYTERAKLKWGAEFTFEELINLDNNYNSLVKMCGITNPAQKETLKALCIIQVKIRQALTIDDSKTLKDLTASYSSLAKAAKLDELIESTKTDDITTVAELYQYFEDNGFQFKFYEGKPQDEIDYCIDDIKQCLRQTVLDSTGLSGLLEQMIKREQSQAEAQKTAEAVEKVSVEDLLQLDPDTMGQPEEEADAELTEYNFDDEE